MSTLFGVRRSTTDANKTIRLFNNPKQRICTCASINHITGFCSADHFSQSLLSHLPETAGFDLIAETGENRSITRKVNANFGDSVAASIRNEHWEEKKHKPAKKHAKAETPSGREVDLLKLFLDNMVLRSDRPN